MEPTNSVETERRETAYQEGEVVNLSTTVERRGELSLVTGDVRGQRDSAGECGSEAQGTTIIKEALISRQYIAGFFDGEGCINLAQGKVGHRVPYLRVEISNTRCEVLRALQQEYGGSLMVKKRTLSTLPNAKTAYRWMLTTAKAEVFIASIFSFLVLKKEQARLALEFQSWLKTRSYEQRIYRVRVEDSTTKYARVKGTRTIKFSRPSYLLRAADFKNRMHVLNKKGLAKAS